MTSSMRLTWAAMRFFGRYSVWLGGLLAERLYFTPWKPRLSDRARAKQEEWLAGTRSRTLSVGRDQIGIFEAGSGPTVLLVHGWGENAATLGAFVRPLVERGYRVVGMDLPAHGGSSGRRTDAIQTAAAVRAVADLIGGVHAVIGHSMGGHSTLMALSSGLRPDAVVALAPAVRPEHVVRGFVALFQVPEKAEIGLRRRIERSFGSSIWSDLAVDQKIANVDVPALVVHDETDEQVPFTDGVMLVRAWRSARLHRTQGLGHMKLIRDPSVVSEAVSFLENVRTLSEPVLSSARAST